MKSRNLIIGLIVVVVIVAAVVVVKSNKKTTTAPQPTPQSQGENPTDTTTEEASATTIKFTGSGFDPKTLTVKMGDTVVVENDSTTALQFDSDPHPAHTANPELNVGQVEPGSSKSFTPTKAGTWGYHNHLSPSQTGSITVQ